MKHALARFCMWLSDLFDRAGWALADMPPAADREHIDITDRPFGMPPDVELAQEFNRRCRDG